LAVGLLGLVGVLGLTACGSSTGASSGGSSTGAASGGSDTSPASSSAQGSRIAVVASTNVWGDIAASIGGDRVAVDAFISDPAQDPHSFEASPRAQLTLSKAALVIENGGGYDDFMDTMLAATGSEAPVINAVKVSGKTAPADGELNEHVWYDFPTVSAVASRIAAELSSIDPSAAATFGANLAAFQQQLGSLTDAVDAVKAAHAGAPVAITEPVPLYLLQAAGLVNKTPAEFSQAIEEGSDVPVRVLAKTLDLFTGKQVKLLVYNAQTTGTESDQVIGAAQQNGIPAVPVTETMPPGEHYVSWMQANVGAVATALG
jgi:zinc/manganese transport system substrate-binding protein